MDKKLEIKTHEKVVKEVTLDLPLYFKDENDFYIGVNAEKQMLLASDSMLWLRDLNKEPYAENMLYSSYKKNSEIITQQQFLDYVETVSEELNNIKM